MLHIQRHFLCNITYVVTAESVGKSLLIQQIKVVLMRDENKTWHAYLGLISHSELHYITFRVV